MKKMTLLFVLLALATGCVVSPYNNQSGGEPGSTVWFNGYAVEPGVEIEIQALDKSTQDWVTVETATSGDAPQHTLGGYKLYNWTGSVTLDDNTGAQSECFYGYSKYFGCGIEGSPQFRVRQLNVHPNVKSHNYTTFEKGGIQCVLEKYKTEGLVDAVQQCASPKSPVITMQPKMVW